MNNIQVLMLAEHVPFLCLVIVKKSIIDTPQLCVFLHISILSLLVASTHLKNIRKIGVKTCLKPPPSPLFTSSFIGFNVKVLPTHVHQELTLFDECQYQISQIYIYLP